MVSRLALCALLAWVLVTAAPVAAGVDHWTAAGPPGGLVEALAADPAHGGHLYAASDLDGLFKTVDGGRRWLRVRTGLPTSDEQWVAHVAVASSHPATVYAAVRGRFEAEPWDGVYRSVDAGMSWERRGDLPVWDALAVSSGDPDVLFAAGSPDAALTATAVFRSLDGGSSWQRVLDLPSATWARSLVVDPAVATTVYLATARGLWRSVDGGETWAKAGAAVGGEPLESLVGLAIAPSDPRTVYAVGPSVYRSDDGGESWRVVAPQPEWCGRRLAVHPRRPETLYLSCNDRLVRSRDGGATWRSLPIGPAGSHPAVRDLALDPLDPSILYVATGSQGVYKSRDGGITWLRVSAGFRRLAVADLVVDPVAARTLFAVTAGTYGPDGLERRWLWRSDDGGDTWRRWLPALEEAVERIVPDPRSPGLFYLASAGGLFVRDETSGSLRRIWDRPVSRLALDAGNPDLLYAVSGSVFRSRDGGRTWRETLTLTSGSWGGERAFELLADPSLPGRVYTLVEDWIVGGEGSFRLLRSDDGGRSWRSVAWPGSDLHLSPSRAPSSPSVLYADTFWSTDGGETWQETGFPGSVVLVVPGDPSTLYAQDAEHLWRSRDGGSSWVALAGGADAEGEDDLRLGWHQVLVAHPAAPERLYRYDVWGVPLGVSRAQPVGAEPILLGSGRFELRAAWRDAEGRYGAATPVRLSDRAAGFALVGRRKLAAVVEVLDRREVTGHFRVLGAGILPVEVTVTVIDRATGLSRDLVFPGEGGASRIDSDSFPPLPELPSAATAQDSPVCGEAKELTLLDGRFRIRVVHRLAPGVDKPVPVAPLRWEAGAACFDDPAVPSVVVQMVDGRAVNGSIWVLVGGLSGEGHAVRVLDTATGAQRSYLHLPGAPAGVADLDAF